MNKYKIGDWIKHKRTKESVLIKNIRPFITVGDRLSYTLQLPNGYTTQVSFMNSKPIEQVYDLDPTAQLLYGNK